jgi:hypothetical protein
MPGRFAGHDFLGAVARIERSEIRERFINPGSAPDAALQPGYEAAVAAALHSKSNRRQPHNCLLAMAAPSLSALNFAHTMLGWISFEPANVAKPQSEPAITFSRPTTLA